MLPSAETQQRASGAQPALQGPRKKDSRGSGADLSMLIARGASPPSDAAIDVMTDGSTRSAGTGKVAAMRSRTIDLIDRSPAGLEWTICFSAWYVETTFSQESERVGKNLREVGEGKRNTHHAV